MIIKPEPRPENNYPHESRNGETKILTPRQKVKFIRIRKMLEKDDVKYTIGDVLKIMRHGLSLQHYILLYKTNSPQQLTLF